MTLPNRILHHPVLGSLSNRQQITFTYNGGSYQAYQGETIASALLASEQRILRYHEESGTPRGFYCNIGHCFECRVSVNGQDGIRACLTLVTEGMVIQSGQKLPNPLKAGESS
ncbi:(2Fe-2S)-binding protein [Caldalkalibacillus mannanilyticus]|uniref:(2Fe-2S)-binding protein n=1 Tax=Caldalkalibacillus mannanilyticus TaxID=1418 RepID=UPI00046A479E|nr:(2Fe-2S)-binding protein [Caldalkalibacillus mannanilyticus]